MAKILHHIMFVMTLATDILSERNEVLQTKKECRIQIGGRIGVCISVYPICTYIISPQESSGPVTVPTNDLGILFKSFNHSMKNSCRKGHFIKHPELRDLQI